MSSFFVTGTDTNVGKTVATRAIIQALQELDIDVVGYKPIACTQDDENAMVGIVEQEGDYGTEDNADVLTLMNTTKQNVGYRDINSYTFGHTMPLFTDQSEQIQIEKINQDLDKLNQKYQTVVVEGCFGWLSPINKHFSFADWVVTHQMPVVLVAGIKEGCINHTLLTVQSIQNLGVPLIGWIANRINPCLGHYAEMIDTLSSKIDAPLLGEIPYIYKPETQNLAKYMTNIERLTYLKTELVR
ncbi:dethiobiotin synthase [Lonepinella sp. MS14435]|uniref:dethiobiotin synthase n=1 Tax=unclassified Lonepinella TaxID=2642006 RepID=UPI0036DB1D0E